MSKLDEMKAMLAERSAKKKAEIEQLIEQRKIEVEIKKLDSPMYAEMMLIAEDEANLTAHIEMIAEMYAAEKRKISYVFGFGEPINKLLTLIKAIQYAKQEVKMDLLCSTGLSINTVDNITDLFGATAYFSPKQLRIVDAIPMNIDGLKEAINMAYLEMGLISTPNFSKFNKANIDYVYSTAEAKAREMLENTLKYSDADVTYTE